MQASRDHRGPGPTFLGIHRPPARRVHVPTQEHTPRLTLARSGRIARAVVLGLSLLSLAGCRCSEDRPYTPFQVASSLPGQDPAPPAAPGPEAAATPGLEASALVLRVPGLPEKWDAFGRTLRAPRGTGFAGGLELPAHGDHPARVLAWVLPKGDGQAQDGGLFAFDQQGAPGPSAVRLPTFLPSGPDCEVALTSLGVTSGGVSSTVQTQCKGRLLPGTATGAFILVTDADAKRPPFVLRLAGGGVAENLQIKAERVTASAGELTVLVDLATGAGAHAVLPLRFVEKASGLSRVSDAPSSDLEILGKELAQLVPKKKEREGALARIDAVRRWVLAICQEAGTSRITDEDGRAFSCGAVKTSLDRLTEAAIEAYLYRDEPWKAVGEYERADYYLGAPPAKTKERWAARIREKSRFVPATVAAVHPLRLGLDVPYPFASPLRYDQDGVLFALTASGEVQRLGPAPPADESSPPDDDARAANVIEAWPLRPKSSDGRLLAALVPSCDRAEVTLSFQAEGGESSPAVPLPFLAPRPCRGLMGKPLPVEPVVWQGPALLSIAAGEPVLSQGTLLEPERPLVWSSSLGIHVWSKDAVVSWKGPELQGLHHCVLPPATSANDVLSVACVRGRTAVEIRQIQPVPAGN